MPSARLFFAIPVSDEVRAAAAQAMAELRLSGADCRWTAPENLHLTLRFLGQTSLERLPELRDVLAKAARRPWFWASFAGLGAFPSWDAPRVVWIGVAEGAEELAALAAALGPPEEGRPFSAHLTLGRLRGKTNLESLKSAADRLRLPPMRQKVERLALYESRLSSAGATYVERLSASIA